MKDKLLELIDSDDLNNVELAFQLGQGLKINMKKLCSDYIKLIKWCVDYKIFERHYFSKNLKQNILKIKTIPTLPASNRCLNYIPSYIDKFTSLIELILFENDCITELPESIGNLKNLEGIDIRGCIRITEIPSSFSKLSKLERLSCYRSGITEVKRNEFLKLFPKDRYISTW